MSRRRRCSSARDSSPVLDYPAGATAAKQGMKKTLKGIVFGLPLGLLGAYLGFAA